MNGFFGACIYSFYFISVLLMQLEQISDLMISNSGKVIYITLLLCVLSDIVPSK